MVIELRKKDWTVVGKRLHQAVRHSGLTIKEFAEKAGVSEVYLRNRIYPPHAEPYQLTMTLCYVTGISCRWLLHGTGEPWDTDENSYDATM